LRKDTEENILKKEGGVNINVEKWHNWDLHNLVETTLFTTFFFYMVKGLSADATDVPQP
jgi:hypothetical protein